VDELAGQITRIEQRLDELSALRAQLRESEQQLARVPALEREAALAAEDRRELDAARAQIEVLELGVEDLRAELAQAQAQLRQSEEASQRVIDGMKSSFSWRITAPLRALARALRRSSARRG
jgi:DNA repair exonuclease SbcCD ATPase subunit